MSRHTENEEGIPWAMWEAIVSRALTGRRGQEALADLEAGLLALPERRLVWGSLAEGGKVCAVGALVARRRAVAAGTTVEDELGRMVGETLEDTLEAGRAAGLSHVLSWHLSWLNDDEFLGLSEEERFEKVLSFAQRAQGKEPAAGHRRS